ncbi:MAG: hypothetical protein WAU31_03360 [Candidatus Moraniibacteriota bacterium]
MTISWKSKRVWAVLSIAIIGLLAIANAYASRLSDNAFSWAPRAVSLSGTPGSTVSFSATAHAGSVLAKTFCVLGAKTSAKLSDNLASMASMVEIVPGNICERDTVVSVTLHLSPSAPAGLVDGSLRLYRTVRIFGKTVVTPIWLAESLPVSLSLETTDDGLPPDPGEAGKATLAGIDSDGDGIRDDIQRYIARTYPGDENINVRKALRQDAEGFQLELLASSDKEESVRLLHDRERDGYCMVGVMGVDVSADAEDAMKERILNTELRSRAWIAFNRHIGGEVSGNVYPWKYLTQCDFDTTQVGGE